MLLLLFYARSNLTVYFCYEPHDKSRRADWTEYKNNPPIFSTWIKLNTYEVEKSDVCTMKIYGLFLRTEQTTFARIQTERWWYGA